MNHYFRVSLTAVFLWAGATLFVSCQGGSEKGANAPAVAHFHCPMHPTYTSDRPGDCPICGMRLVPLETKEEDPNGAQETVPSGHPPADLSSVTLSEEREQLIGVKTSPVERRILIKRVRASGRIAYDPDLYNAVVEFREALKSREKAKRSPWADVRSRTEGMMASSRLRLRQMGLSDSQIDRLGRAKGDPTNLLLGRKGGSVWVYAQIYEYEVGLVKAGQEMEITSVAFPGKTFHGHVGSVDTILNSETRTLRVRGEVSTEGMLTPEMYVEVTIPVSLGRRLSVPEEAVMDTGTRKISFVKKGRGQFEPREVAVGQEAEDAVEVLSGLTEGEEVVTSANFLIDSESKLKAALSRTKPHTH